jgi:signal transduction histidine kinase
MFFVTVQTHEELQTINKVLGNYQFKAVVSDLVMVSNPLIGLSLLSTAGLSSPKCYRALVTGHIDGTIVNLCKGMGIDTFASKDEPTEVITNILRVLGPPFGRPGAEELTAQMESLGRRFERLQGVYSELRSQNRKIRAERSRLRRELRAHNVPDKKRRDKYDGAERNNLVKRAESAERRVQMVLGHQHDLKSIAAAVTTTLGNLCAQPELLPPAIKHKLEGAWIASRQTSVLIASTLDIATDEKPSTRSTGSIPLAFNEASRIIADQLPDRINVTISLPEEMRVAKIPDNMLVRCALNLFTNAKDAIPGRGWIEVTIKGRSSARAKHVEVVVQDNGTGIKKRDLPKVFDWGFTTKGSRYGMGLFIVRKIMEKYGGQVRIESKRGKGTAVILKIPVG